MEEHSFTGSLRPSPSLNTNHWFCGLMEVSSYMFGSVLPHSIPLFTNNWRVSDITNSIIFGLKSGRETRDTINKQATKTQICIVQGIT